MLDLRPFLYPAFTWPYKKIEEALAAFERGEKEEKNVKKG